jgi:hypothetical protein
MVKAYPKALWLCRKVYELYHMLKHSSEKNTTNCR